MRENLFLHFIIDTETQTRLKLSCQKVCYQIMLAINKQNNRHTTPPQTNIEFIMPLPNFIVSLHKSGTWNNWGRQHITPRDNRCLNRKGSHSKRNELPSPVKPVPPPLNNSVINPPQLSSVHQHSSSSS